MTTTRPPDDSAQDSDVSIKDIANNQTSLRETRPRSEELESSPSKRIRLEDAGKEDGNKEKDVGRINGIAHIKPEYLISRETQQTKSSLVDDDAAEASGPRVKVDVDDNARAKPKNRGQNTHRSFGSSKDVLALCQSRVSSPELSPNDCTFGTKCRYEHDLRKYLKLGRREDLKTFDGLCPAWDAYGTCNAGWRCRFSGSHSTERENTDGTKELILIENDSLKQQKIGVRPETVNGIVNIVTARQKLDLTKRKMKTPKSDAYMEWMQKQKMDADVEVLGDDYEQEAQANGDSKQAKEDNRAQYIDPPFLPSEKRRIYYGPETPILAPLTTQGNLPFRRLCVGLGAQVTWSEMAMGLPLIKGEKGEWALLKAHESELSAPKFEKRNSVPSGYDHSRDLKFGAQVAANKPWIALKTTEVLTTLCPHLRAIDLNCGCPIDLVYRQGAGSALLDAPGRLEKMLRGMNALSGEIPITVKIRMGTKDNKPNAFKLIRNLAIGGPVTQSTGEGPAGVAAITLHGRSRQQRYTKRADWSYISECAALIKRLNAERNARADTVAEADARDLSGSKDGMIYFVGNGDCFSHVDYFDHIEEAKVDSVMVARGALIKPWIFEEIEKGQYLDKSASERLDYISKFARYGLEAWGTDEVGLGTTRRFLLEWLSFACRYVPIGLLEYLPPHINDRPPAFRGRNELETLLSSDNYKDWIKISEMFLGPAHPNFRFEPKHKSNSYEIEAEG